MKPEEMSARQAIAATALGEARGEGRVGEDAVVCVAVNRAKIAARFKAKRGKDHPLYGDGTVAAACLAGCEAEYPQFDAWRRGDPNRAYLESLDWEHPDDAMDVALEVADEALSGALKDVTNGATHYKTTVLPWPKSWGPPVPARTVIGHHSFYQIP